MKTTQTAGLDQIFYPVGEINFVLIAILVAGAAFLVFAVQRLLPRIAEKTPGRFRHYILPLIPMTRLIILVGAVLVIVPLIIRPSFQNFIAIFGAVGLAVGFAFKDYVSSLIAGVVAIYEQPYRPGDWVRIEDAYGEVKSMGLRSLALLTPDDTLVTIPHSKIWNTSVHNTNAGKCSHLCVADFYLHPEHDAKAVRQALIDVALTSPYLELGNPVSVVVAEKPWGTHYRLKAYPLDNRDEFPFVSDLTVRGKTALSEMGVKPALVPLAER